MYLYFRLNVSLLTLPVTAKAGVKIIHRLNVDEIRSLQINISLCSIISVYSDAHKTTIITNTP